MLYSKKEIEKIIPHRYEMSLLDGILEANEKERTITGVINLDPQKWFFKGHFPQMPVMPGVLQIEALAQTGVFFIFKYMPQFKDKIGYITSIDRVRFKQKVLPGDQVLLKVKINEPKTIGKNAFGKAIGEVVVNRKVASVCEMSFFIG